MLYLYFYIPSIRTVSLLIDLEEILENFFKIGTHISSVVPGYTVDSNITISFLFFLNRACQSDFLTLRASKIDRNTIDNNYHLQ